jgi:hypothetical protein
MSRCNSRSDGGDRCVEKKGHGGYHHTDPDPRGISISWWDEDDLKPLDTISFDAERIAYTGDGWFRRKVFGGWIVYANTSVAPTFIPDPEHEWRVSR